jgi:hypothetical protein
VNVSPEGSGNINSPQFVTPTEYPQSFTCSIDYILTAVPDSAAGYEFIHWAVNDTTATDNPLTITVADGNKSVTAVFKIPGTTNRPPTANAGDDQTVVEGDQARLTGSASSDPDDGIRSYLWKQTGGDSVTLSNAAAASPTFTAPEIFTDSALLTFELTVEDYSGATDSDTVTVTVRDSGNDPPVADAGPDQTVIQRFVVTLDASGSSDPNGIDDIKSYLWQQTEGVGVTLSDETAIKPTFTAPEIYVADQPETLVFKLTVKDAGNETSEDYVTIVVERGPIGGDSSNAGCFISGAAR